jgi:hypothetical protein
LFGGNESSGFFQRSPPAEIDIERPALKPLPAEPYVYAEWNAVSASTITRRGGEGHLPEAGFDDVRHDDYDGDGPNPDTPLESTIGS